MDLTIEGSTVKSQTSMDRSVTHISVQVSVMGYKGQGYARYKVK